ncbi:MAG: GMC oxidoreductase [Syntrophaceae bacterium]
MIKDIMLYNDFDARKEYDVIVVGSGPAGATVAKKMARAGKSVLILERGMEINWIKQNSVAQGLQLKNCGLSFSKEFNFVGIGNAYGGATNVYCGTAVEPAYGMFDEVGVDLRADAKELADEMWVVKAPDNMVGEGNIRLRDAARDCGYNWDNIQKHINMDMCIPNCSECMLSCGRGAKWTARIPADDAIRHGGTVLCNTRVTNVIVENGKVTGVQGKRFGMNFEAHGKSVVLAAGVSDVGILRKAGIDGAGRTFACDFLVFTGGVVDGVTSYRCMDMAVGTLEDWNDGFIMTELGPTWAMHAMMLSLAPQKIMSLLRTFKYTWIMTKVQDQLAGEIYPDNKVFGFSKPVMPEDQRRMKAGDQKARNILKKMKADNIVTLPHCGAHPCATAKIGDVVDTNLETEVKNLYVCDASVFPRAMGLPVVWTVAALGNRLAKHMVATEIMGGKATKAKNK